MDNLYYSNYCKHSQKVIQTLVKGNVIDKINCICIDKRGRDAKTGGIYIYLEDGSKVIMPPNLHNIPALLMVKQNFRFLYGDEILQHFHPEIIAKSSVATHQHGEPAGFHLGGSRPNSSIVSDKFTYYNMSTEEVNASANRPIHNYVSTEQDNIFITTPPDSYTSNRSKFDDEQLQKLQQARMDELSSITQNRPPLGL